MTALFDSHCHIQDAAFDGDRTEVITRARDEGLQGLLVCGYDAPSNLAALDLAAGFDIVHAAVGFHPHDARTVSAAMLRELAEQASMPSVVAVGEIGLDYYRDLSPRDVQRRVLEEQLAVAVEAGKPVSVHSRGAEDEIRPHLAAYASASPLRQLGRPLGVMHCFGGSAAQALGYVELGLLVSVACSVTYPISHQTRRLAAELPLESLLIETDSPYLPAQAMRGRRNEPAFVGAAAEAIAAIRGVPPEAVARQTTENAAALFGLELALKAGRR